MLEVESRIPATEIRVVAMDLNHHGKPDTVVIEFYKSGSIDYAVEVVEKDENGFTRVVSKALQEVDNDTLIGLANLALHLH